MASRPRQRQPRWQAADSTARNGKRTKRGTQPVSANLTREEARARAALIKVASYQVNLDLTGDDTTFSAVSVIRFRCGTPGAATFIDLTAPAVRWITLNDVPVSLSAFDGDRITLTGLAADNEL